MVLLFYLLTSVPIWKYFRCKVTFEKWQQGQDTAESLRLVQLEKKHHDDAIKTRIR